MQIGALTSSPPLPLAPIATTRKAVSPGASVQAKLTAKLKSRDPGNWTSSACVGSTQYPVP
jgi:hypothetical protein